MDESFFLQQLNETPGDVCLLRQYAAWLIDRGDGRGEHLLAELDFQAAREVLVQAEDNLGKFRGSRPQDFEWLNSVNPMVTRAPISGRFYASPASGQAPFVQVSTSAEGCLSWASSNLRRSSFRSQPGTAALSQKSVP